MSDYLCAKSGCLERGTFFRRLDRATVIPFCARCNAEVTQMKLLDGQAELIVVKARLCFWPEEMAKAPGGPGQ